MTPDQLTTLIFLIILVCCSSFFSATETAFTSANRLRLKARSEEGSKSAKLALAVIDKFDKFLTTILVGNNIVNILTTSVSTVLAIQLFGENNGPAVATVAVTVILLIFGEILPKTIAKICSDGYSTATAGFVRVLMIILTPVSLPFQLLQKGASKMFSRGRKSVSMTEQELIHIIDEIEDEGVLEEQESNLVKSALEFDETIAEEIVTPRVNISAIDINSGVEELRDLFFREEYSRIPVYEKSIDHIVGVVNQKDFFEKLLKGEHFIIRDIVQETMHVPNLMRISELLKQMQKEKIHLAVVVDQYGGTAGIVTLEDILEELVGEIWDESDEVKAPVRIVSENVYETSGDVTRSDFNRFFERREIDVRINSESNTVSGWIYELFGKIPEINDSVRVDNMRVSVKSITKHHADIVKIEVIKSENTED